jgi:3-hydroxybutyryl-CoA dehydratase
MATTAAAAHGMYFEELEPGFSITSAGRTITETDIVMFAGLSGDYNPLHTDEEYSKQTMFGGRIAHGLLGLSIASGLAMQVGFMLGTVEAFRELSWQFRKPVVAGDTVHIEAKTASKKAIRGYRGGLVSLDINLINQKGESVHKGTWTLLVKGKPEPAAPAGATHPVLRTAVQKT